MSELKNTLRRIFITTCLLTRTTEWAANRLGAGFFLPALFVLRYSAMGGLEPRLFAEQLNAVRSFEDDAWCGHWDAMAREELAGIGKMLPGLASVMTEEGLAMPARLEQNAAWAEFQAMLAPLGPRIAELMTMDAQAEAKQERTSKHATSVPDSQRAIAALRCMVRAITYYQVSAFPGGSVARMNAYHRSRSLFHVLTKIVGPILGLAIEHRRIEVNGQVAEGYLVTPPGSQPCPLAIITNGLEGTVQELAIPLLKYHDSGMAVFVMEMPGTYAYTQPMSAASEAIYHGVIDHLARHPRVDPGRIGFVGVSFGGYWAARLAATSPRLRCVVACGAPTHRSFQIQNTIGVPEIIVRALRNTTGATSLHDLMKKLRALSLREFYRRIKAPLLVINGDQDTLLSTRDSIDLADRAQQGELKLYPNDDHCAMAHYREWLDLSQTWLQKHFLHEAGENSVS